MTTTDPTITIAGLRAQVESLETSLRAALDDGATSEEVRLIAAAENACLTAERDALAAQLAEVRAELSSDATKRDGRISAICRALDIDDDRDVVDAIDEMRSRHANDLASERAHLAAGRTRIAGLEQAANERSAEVARLTARVAELEARPVNARAALIGVLTATKHGPGGRGGPGDCDADCVKCEADRALASLGAECRGCGHGDPVTNADADRLRTAIARAISDATAARGTVGGLLATAPVGAIVEFWHGATANQITTRVGGIDDRAWLWRYRNPNGEWSPWDYEAPSPDDLSQPGEIVPSDPSQRAPLLAAAPNLHPDGCHTADPTAPRDCTSDGHHECTSCARFDAAGRAAMGDDPIGGPRGPLPKGG